MSTLRTIGYRTVIDLSHPLDRSTPPYPGDPPIRIETMAEITSDGYGMTEWTSVFHTGTHLDAPSHFLADGTDMLQFAAEACILTACLADVQGHPQIEPQHLPPELPPGTDALLLRTGWGKRYGSEDYFDSYPVLSVSMAHWCVSRGHRLLGFDLPSPDTDPYPIHPILLGQGIHLLENLNRLDLVPANKLFHLICVPLPVRAEASWVRPLALIP